MRPCPPRPIGVVERTASHVRVTLQDRVLRYEVEERFVNRGGTIAEADYVFPLPKNAAFEDLKLSINGELVSGETMDAGRARGIYEEIVRRMRDPALVEWMDHGMLRARIFPINPGEEKRVVVRFQAVAPREGDALRIDYRRGTDPASRPVRIMPVDDVRSSDDARDARRYDMDERETFTLTLPTSSVYGTPYSPTHRLVRRERDGRLTLEAEGSTRDVTVLVPLRSTSQPAISLLANSNGRDERFALITLTPPARTGRGTPRDVTFVLDVSGSMSGRKLAQAKAAGHQLLGTLSPRDRFRLIDFSTDVRTFRDAFVQATPENLRAANDYLDGLQAQGSTNIAGALDEALAPRANDERLSPVLMLTDGAPTVGETRPEAIASSAAAKRGDARVFTFGVGADVNAMLVERLAIEGRGTASFVRPEEDVERAVSVVASRLTDPLVTDLRVRVEGTGGNRVRLDRLIPAAGVDLFAGEDLVLLARYDGDGDATLRFTGRSANGPVEWTQRVRFPERERDNVFIPRLWATQRLGWLAAEKRRIGGSREIDDEIRALGERYAIPTEFTSYLVQEPGMVAQSRADGLNRREMAPRMMSKGVSGGVSAPAPASSMDSFDAAKVASEQRAARSLEDANASAKASNSSVSRRIGDRVMVLVDSVWTDARHASDRKTVKVRAYSEAWFTLARELPGLSDVFALGDRVIVDGKSVAIEVVENGAEKLDAAQVATIRSQW
jgi:Ca-activated chloride channel family protein